MIDDPYGMALPEGMTCSDCAHWTRCSWLLSRDGQETICDWSPSRFERAASCDPPPRELAEARARRVEAAVSVFCAEVCGPGSEADGRGTATECEDCPLGAVEEAEEEKP